MPRILIALAGLAMALPTAALADSTFQMSQSIWKLMDACTQQAQRAHPDYTHEGRLQREASREACMRANNLPYEGEGSSAPPPVASQLQQRAQPQQLQQMQQFLQQRPGAGR